LGLDISLVSGLFSSLPIFKILEVFAGSGMFLENAKLGNGAHQNHDEANRASSTNGFISGTFLLFVLELVPEVFPFSRLLLAVRARMTSLVLTSFTVFTIAAMMLGFFFLLRLLILHGLEFLSSHFLEGLLLLFGLLFEAGLDVFHELRQVEFLLEISATEIHGLLLEGSSDVKLVSNLRIDVLELSLFTEHEGVEHEVGKDTVEGPSESDVGVLFSLEESSDHGPHCEHSQSSRKEHLDHADLEEVVVQTKLILSGLLRRNKVRLRINPWKVASLGNVRSIEVGTTKSNEAHEEEDHTAEAENTGAAAKFLVEHVDSESSPFGLLIHSRIRGLISRSASGTTEFFLKPPKPHLGLLCC
jgi:hypothetical protein